MPVRITEAQAAAQAVRESSARLLNLHRELDQALEAARRQVAADDTLSAEGRSSRLQQLEQQAREAYGRKVEAERATVDAARKIVRTFADEQAFRPADQLVEDAAQRRAWERVKALLEAGRSVRDVAAGADAVTLRAMRAELPAYLEAQVARDASAKGGLQLATSNAAPWRTALRAVDEAMVRHLSGEAQVAAKLALEFDELTPKVEQRLQNAQLTSVGRDPGLAGAIAARFAGAPVGEVPAGNGSDAA